MSAPTFVRIDHNSEPFEVCERGSAYITLLQQRLFVANQLAHAVMELDPTRLSISVEYMTKMKEQASYILTP